MLHWIRHSWSTWSVCTREKIYVHPKVRYSVKYSSFIQGRHCTVCNLRQERVVSDG